MVYMAACFFSAQDINSFFRIDPVRTERVVFGHEAGEWFANDQTYFQGSTGVILGRTTWAFKGGDVLRILEYNIARLAVGYDLL
jgi:hypothetical protein